MKRPDADMIRKVKKAMGINGGVNDKRLREVLDMPYFYMSHKPMREFNFTTSDDALTSPATIKAMDMGKAESWGVPDWEMARRFAARAEFVYDEFVLSARNEMALDYGTHIEQVRENYWGYVGHREKADAVFVVIEYPDTGEMLNWEGVIEEREIINEQGEKVSRLEPVMAPQYKAEMRHLFQKMDLPKGVTFDGFMSGLNQQAVEYYLFICQLMAYLKYGDKHAVEVVPEKPKRVSPALTRDRPWLGATGPRVLLLDRMPTTQSEGTGTHASPKPHRRRGHWKTLSPPRFRHHPQYGKKIYVKPSFVGPRQVSYEGNIYRLVEPLDDALA